MSFNLHRANKEELEEIINELSIKNTPASLPMLIILKTYINFPITAKNVYVSEDPRFKSFVAVTNIYAKFSFPTINLYWDNELLNEDDLRNLLKRIPNWDWSKYFLVCYIIEPLCHKIVKILSEEDLCGHAQQMHRVGGQLWLLNETNITNFKLPDGYKIGRLSPYHVPYILSRWAWQLARFHDLETTKSFFQNLPSIGIFREEDDILESSPVSYVVMYETGIVGMTSTDKDHQRKGLSIFAETELAKILLRKGIPPAVYIEEGNEISFKFHRKVGYRQVSRDGGFYANFDTNAELNAQNCN